MARSRGIDQRIRAAEALRHAPPGPGTQSAVAAALDDPSGLVVAAGARAAQAHRLDGLLPSLLTALDRRYEDAAASDPQCHAKLALLDALDALGHRDGATWLRAARHVQMEPVWGGRQDSATRLRIRAAGLLAAHGHHDLFRVLADLLADPSPEVRAAAGRLAGGLGGERAALLLRLRLQLPDDEPANAGDYAAGLLAAEGEDALALVAPLLAGEDGTAVAEVALALGESRLPGALPPLLAALDGARDPGLRRTLITAIALLRSDAAIAALLELAGTAATATARMALEGLRLRPLNESARIRLERLLATRRDLAECRPSEGG